MSSISPIPANSPAYPTTASVAAPPKPAATVAPIKTSNDPDHDGDTDGAGLDVNG